MSKLVVAGVAYTVDADSPEEAENLLLDFLDEHLPQGPGISVLKLWVSAREDDESRGFALKAKEAAALGGL